MLAIINQQKVDYEVLITLKIRRSRMHFLWKNVSDFKPEVGSCSVEFKITLSEFDPKYLCKN